MDNSVSVSKGCFVYKPQTHGKKKQKKPVSLPAYKDPWYGAYKKVWSNVESELETLREEVFSEILQNLIEHVQNCHSEKAPNAIGNEIPSATLLTGMNLPDHDGLFVTLSNQLRDNVTPFIATLQARHCGTIRSTVEHMVLQFMRRNQKRTIELEDEEDEDEKDKSIKKRLCNFITLSTWYKEQIMGRSPKKSPRKKLKEAQNFEPLIVIIPNVEEFSPHVLQDFILIASGYIKSLPLVFVFGVATAVSTLHRSVPHHVSSKLRIKVFHSPPSVSYLNQVLEKVLLTSSCLFHLDDKSFKMLTDVFLFYDFSVHGFIQGYKFCMMEHFFNSNWKVLCCPPSELNTAVKNLSKEDLEELRQLPSFRHYVDTLPKKEKAPLLVDDAHFKSVIIKLMKQLHLYLQNFHLSLKCLHILTALLPNAPLGKQMRELYSMAIGSSSVCESPQFKECFQLLGFQSREELVKNLNAVKKALKYSELEDVRHKIHEFLKKIKTITSNENQNNLKSPKKLDITENMNRFQLKEKLMELSRQEKPVTAYEKIRKEVLEYLFGTVFPKFLVPPTSVPLHEVLFFYHASRAKRLIMGTPRAAVHTALNRPHYYLQCDCCKSEESTSIIPTMPDICIVYKLHLECGRLINMYDWLQAFLSIVNPSDCGEEQRDVPPEMRARFTRAVAELQFLGFIKSSRKKTDHVMRLTWGTS